MLDKLPPELRHLVLMLLVPVLGYVSAQVVPAWISDPVLAGLAGVVLTALIAYFTPLTRQYGVGSDKAAE
jgi:hypothetical protein